MKDRIHVIIKEPGRRPEPREIPNTLEELQGFVGGYIEVYDLAADLAIICNEEGKLLGLPLNCGKTFEAVDLWTGEVIKSFNGVLEINLIEPHACRLFRVKIIDK